jgi:hypothetical protein
VAAQDESALEAQQQVLANRLDGLEPPPIQPFGHALRGRARVWCLDRHALADEHLEAAGGAMERVAFGHA